MGEMVATIAHELRNPLGSLEIFASLAQKEVSPGTPLSDWVGYMRVQVGRLDRLIGNLLSYTRPPEIVLDRLVVGEFLSRAEADFRRILEMRSRAGDPLIRLTVGGDMNAVIEADEALLYQAIYNLVTNSFQVLEGRPDAEVVVEGRVSEDGTVCFRWKTMGPGFPKRPKSMSVPRFFPPGQKGQVWDCRSSTTSRKPTRASWYLTPVPAGPFFRYVFQPGRGVPVRIAREGTRGRRHRESARVKCSCR
jgi:K+-sensing histidine kinase KdpD